MYEILKVCTEFFLGLNTDIFAFHLGTMLSIVHQILNHDLGYHSYK